MNIIQARHFPNGHGTWPLGLAKKQQKLYANKLPCKKSGRESSGQTFLRIIGVTIVTSKLRVMNKFYETHTSDH